MYRVDDDHDDFMSRKKNPPSKGYREKKSRNLFVYAIKRAMNQRPLVYVQSQQ